MTYAKVLIRRGNSDVIAKVKRSCWSDGRLFVRYFFNGRRVEEWVCGDECKLVDGAVCRINEGFVL